MWSCHLNQGFTKLSTASGPPYLVKRFIFGDPKGNRLVGISRTLSIFSGSLDLVFSSLVLSFVLSSLLSRLVFSFVSHLLFSSLLPLSVSVCCCGGGSCCGALLCVVLCCGVLMCVAGFHGDVLDGHTEAF